MPIIYNAATTLNGFLADDHDSLQWLFDVPGADDAEADNQAFLASVDALVMGSTTYEWLLDALDSPAELTAQYGDRPIWVFTSRDLPVPDGSRVRLVGGAVAEALPAILEYLLAEGYTPVPVSQLLLSGDCSIDNNGRQQPLRGNG